MMTKAARDVLAERKRQIQKEGWSAYGDDQYRDQELARAAASYAYPLPKLTAQERFHPETINLAVLSKRPPADWPWNEDWWKPTTQRRNLVKAGALILAEIERLDRAKGVESDPRPDQDVIAEIMTLIREFWTEEQVGEYLSAEHPQFGMSALEVIAAGRADELLNSLKALSEGAYI